MHHTRSAPPTRRPSSGIPAALPQHERDLATLATGGETGWWDEHGRPAPWPADFFDHDTTWRPETSDTPHSTNL